MTFGVNDMIKQINILVGADAIQDSMADQDLYIAEIVDADNFTERLIVSIEMLIDAGYMNGKLTETQVYNNLKKVLPTIN
jgi:hypothetical protein